MTLRSFGIRSIVCLLVYLRNHTTKLHYFYPHCLWPWLGSPLWWRFDTLCTVAFVDDVMLSHNGLLWCVVCITKWHSVRAKTIAMIPTKFCSAIKITNGCAPVAKSAIYDCLVLEWILFLEYTNKETGWERTCLKWATLWRVSRETLTQQSINQSIDKSINRSSGVTWSRK